MAEMNAGVLRGINVLDFGRAVAGGFCTRVLADMGARVIKIEAPITGDHMRLLGPFHGESWLMPPTISPIFLHCNAGKESLALDLKKPESIGLIKRLIPRMDVVSENFTPHVMPGLGLAYDDLRRIREDIVMCSISGFGAEGPLADTVANDPVIQAMSGMLSVCGEENGYPYLAGNGIADTASAMSAAMAIMAALLERLRTGAGQHIDVSMMHTLLAMDSAAAPYSVVSHGEHAIPRGGRFHHLACPWGTFKGPQGRYMVVVAAHNMQWENLVRLMGRPDLIDAAEFATAEARLKNREGVHAIIEEFLQTFETAEAAFQALSEAKILAGIALDPWEAASHLQTVQRDMMREVHHPYTGPLSILTAAPRFSRNATTVGRAPFVGEHNRPVLREFLGLSDAEMDHLQESGALFEDVTVAHLDAMP
jgi:crotonobetainyl-CoA:carnitine CoA-transferase CaiB-like acyl-CoA transferase